MTSSTPKIPTNAKIVRFNRGFYNYFPLYDYAAITMFGGTGTTGYFTLAQTAGYTELTSLFDTYRIRSITVTFMFSANTSEAGATYALPNLIWAIDKDDATALGGVANFMEYENRGVARLDKPVSITFQPLPATALYNGAFSAYGRAQNVWIDCANASVQHYGIKWAIDPCITGAGNNVTGRLTVVVDFDLEMKNFR
jgi:hypothetical protein